MDAQSDDEIERDIARDPDWQGQNPDWHAEAQAVMPVNKRSISLRLDEEVVSWFRAQGAGYQTRMNAVLLAYKRRQEKVAG